MALKQEVLKVLEEQRGESVSGQELSRRLQVSRTAVWKAVEALRQDGYVIDSRTRLGYSLALETDRLTSEGIGASLTPELRDQVEILSFSEIDSTNNEAKRRLASGYLADDDRLLVITADQQTAGRGRMGRSFYSPPETGIYMSVVFLTKTSLSDAVSITGAAAVAVARAVRRLGGGEPEIKWVNDVYLNGKKICGILTEASAGLEMGSTQHIIVGIGINCSTEDFPADIADRAGALDGEVRRCALCAGVIEELHHFLVNISDRPWMEEYRRLSLVLGKEIFCIQNGRSVPALALDIDDAGGLTVRLEDGTKTTLNTGEISVRLR